MDYNYTESTTSSWQRANRIIIDHPIPGTGRVSTISFVEEIAVALPDGRFATSPVGVLTEALLTDQDNNNLNEVVQLIDPVTGQPIEGQTITYAAAQVMMHSLYLHVAAKRDAILNPETTP